MGAGPIWRVVRGPLAFGGILAGQVYHAINRGDLPYFPDQDLDGVFGDPELPTLRLTVMGDSSVTAPGVFPKDDAWARRSSMAVSDRYRVHLTVVAVGGSRVADVMAQQLDLALATDPDIAWVAIGSNDALRHTRVTEFEHQYRSIVERLSEAVPVVGCSGIGDLGTIPRLPAIVAGVARVRARSFDRAIARAITEIPNARKTIAWGTQWTEFETDVDTFAGDLFHASARGHRLFADRGTTPVLEELVAMLEAGANDQTGSVESSTSRSPQPLG